MMKMMYSFMGVVTFILMLNNCPVWADAVDQTIAEEPQAVHNDERVLTDKQKAYVMRCQQEIKEVVIDHYRGDWDAYMSDHNPDYRTLPPALRQELVDKVCESAYRDEMGVAGEVIDAAEVDVWTYFDPAFACELRKNDENE